MHELAQEEGGRFAGLTIPSLRRSMTQGELKTCPDQSRKLCLEHAFASLCRLGRSQAFCVAIAMSPVAASRAMRWER